jgi:HlyD family secretion protein
VTEAVPLSMDRPRSDRSRRIRGVAYIGMAILVLAGLCWVFVTVLPSQGSLYVSRASVAIGEVRRGSFEDFVPVRVEIAPDRSTQVTLMQGGRVDEIFARDGMTVARGDVLVRLSNPEFQLIVTGQRVELLRSLEDSRSRAQQLNQTLIDREATLDDATYQLNEARRELSLRSQLFERGLVSTVAIESLRGRLEQAEARERRAREALSAHTAEVSRQAATFATTESLLRDQLRTLEASSSALEVRAGAAGILTGFQPELGASLTAGTRIGRIDDAAAFKLTATMEEFYLPQVRIDQAATIATPSGPVRLKVTSVRSQVENGRFGIDLVFVDPAPGGLRPGQSFEGRLTLSRATEAIVAESGPWLEGSGQAEAFVVDPDMKRAVRRQVRLGRQSPGGVEVLNGLIPGDRIVTSDYERFGTARTLLFRNQGAGAR